MKEANVPTAAELPSPPWLAAKSQKLRQYLDRVQPPDSLVLVLTAVVTGTGTGLGAVAFIWLLAEIGAIARSVQDLLGTALGLIAVMALAGLLVGFIVDHWAREAKGHGVPEVMEAVALRAGRIRPRIAALKVLASSLTIGAGGSAGREGPIVQVGSALGSTIGQLLHFSAERVRTLVACGAAAGIAATFNAPIAGSIFALEVILGRFTVRYFGAVVISAVSAAIVGRSFLGNEPAFAVPAYPLNSLGELPVYITLGLLAALIAVLFIRVLYRAESLFDQWRVPPSFKAALGMILTALVGLLLPGREVLGSGMAFIGNAIAFDFDMSLQLMLAMLLLKIIATTFTLGSGNSGGVFAPSLFVGAMLGGIIGNLANAWWPSVAVNPGAYAIVGMAAVFSGAARAPITAVLIVFEMSNDYQLILPLMLATVLSTLLAEHLFRESIYTLKLRLKGITLQRGRDVDIMQGLFVREAMTRDVYVVEEDMPLPELGRFFERTHSHSFPMVDKNHHLAGVVSITDYERAIGEGGLLDGRVARDIATTTQLLVAYEDEPMGDALARLAVRDVNKLPVVSREDPGRVVGVIRRRDIIKAYNIALARRTSHPGAPTSVRLTASDQAEFLEVELPAGSPAVGKSLVGLSPLLPQDCVIVAIRRQGNLLIPHGDTRLRVGDQVTTFLRRGDASQLRRCLLGDPRGEAAYEPE
ncbi:MAG: chloride channel protein [Anaerolineae bacterium]|nr:chloride channel protein [Anaerolineae bacterium]